MRELTILCSGRLAARFFRDGDRYAHEIGVESDDGFTALFASREGAPEENWPPSPPLQHLHVEQRGEGQVLLLIGKAGDGHWSAAVQANDNGQIEFDIACRGGRPPERIGSTYRTAPLLQPLRRGEWRITTATESIHVTCEALDYARRVDTPPGALLIVPALADEYPATLRWRFRFGIDGGGD